MLHCPRNVMRTVAYSGFFLATCFAPACFTPALAADPTGDWKVADGCRQHPGCRMQWKHCGARLSWEKTPGGRDKNNPDGSKQNRPTLGMPILIDMKRKPGVDRWEGQVYNAKDGQFYSSTIKPVGSDQLEIQGCVLGFLCGGETWTRVAGPIPSSPANSMAKGAPKTAGAPAPKTAAPITTATARRPPHRPTRLPSRPVKNWQPAPRKAPTRLAISVYSPTSRGLPISAGWNNSTAASVVTSESASSLPMLAVPG